MRAAFIAILLTFTTQAGAENIEVGDTYFCNMIEFVSIGEDGDWKVTPHKLEKFKFQVTKNAIVFSGNGYFGDRILPKTFHDKELLQAGRTYPAGLSLALDARKNPVHFVYARAHWGRSYLMAANCDKF